MSVFEESVAVQEEFDACIQWERARDHACYVLPGRVAEDTARADAMHLERAGEGVLRRTNYDGLRRGRQTGIGGNFL